MTTEANKAIVRRLLEEGFNTGNMAVLDEMLADDFVNHNPSEPASVDREGLKQGWAAICAGFPDQRSEIDDLIAEKDQVVKRSTFRGTQTGEFNGIPPTGRPVTLQVISIYRITDGKVKEIYWAYDNLSTLQQLGIVPIPEQVGA